MSASPILQVQNLSKSFPGVIALKDVSLEIDAGKVHAVMGENGAGKSTLMKILVGLHAPDSGGIRLDGKTVRIRTPHEALRLGIAMIPQELLPFRELTVAENISMGREATRRFPGWLDHAAIRAEAVRLLGRLGVSIPPGRKMRELSAAEMQTVEIAKALAHNARVIIMDEPTSAISEREVELLFDVVADLRNHGVAVIYISHKMDEIFRIADTVTVLRDGCHVATHPAAELDERKLIALMVGREVEPPPSAHEEAGEVALQVNNLSAPGKFHNIGFTLRCGEILGLAGLMGAGRTDLVNAICGLVPPASGEIRVKGKSRRIRNPAAAIKAGIALVSEDRRRFGFVPRMSVTQNITLAGVRNILIDHRAEVRMAAEQIRSLSIKVADPDQAVANLSGGNQQKVVIAKALLAQPDILILDEPTRGIDVGAKADVYAIIRRLARDGKAILMVSSELPELLALSDRLLVMRQGEVTAELDPRLTTQEEIMQHAMPS